MSADENAGREACPEERPGAPDAAATAPVMPRKNTIGRISLICGLVAAVLIFAAVPGAWRIHERMMNARHETREEQRALGREPTPEEKRAIEERHQERLNKIEQETLFYRILIWFGVAGAALTPATIVLAIVGLKQKNAPRDAAVIGLGLGIGLALVVMCYVSTG